MVNGKARSAGRRLHREVGRVCATDPDSDLPPKKVLASYIKQAMKLNEEGVTAPVKHEKPPKLPGRTPPGLPAALKKNKKARATYDAFSTSAKREYVVGSPRPRPTRRAANGLPRRFSGWPKASSGTGST